MREIKFRAWDKERNCMRECVTIGCTNSDWPTLAREPWNQNFINSVEGEYELMQYTGLKDKNGKEIYESDIVECFGENFEVIYDNCKFILKGFYCGCFDVPNDAFSEGIGCMEVIGDIYQNPNMLEVKS